MSTDAVASEGKRGSTRPRSRTVELGSARFSIACVFVVGFVLQAGVILWTLMRGEIRAVTAQTFVLTLLTIYSVPLAVIGGELFASPREARKRVSVAMLRAALISSVLWNLLLAWRTFYFSFGPDFSETAPEELVRYWGDAAAASGFLIAGLLSYFYAAAKQQNFP